MTKEERFLLKLAEVLGGSNSWAASEDLQKQLRLTAHSFWNQFNGLARANFVVKNKSGQVQLTERGWELVAALKG